MKPTISIALIILGLTFSAPSMAGTAFELAPLPPLPSLGPSQSITAQSEITPERQYVIDQLERNRRQEAEKKRIEAAREAARWRKFRYRCYLWDGWKRVSGDTRITQVKADGHRYQIAVTCSGLRVSHNYRNRGWSKWQLPDSDEEEMLIELCSQIPGAPKAVVKPKTSTKRDIWIRKTCTGSLIDCATRL